MRWSSAEGDSAQSDLERYYPKSYWVESQPPRAKTPHVEKLLFHLLSASNANNNNNSNVNSFVRQIARRAPSFSFAKALLYGIRPADRLLDVGCGLGDFICSMAQLGLPAPLGVDPFVKSDIFYKCGARVIRSHLRDLDEGNFNVITFHHSLEHVPDPVETLRSAATRLVTGGACIVRVPTTSSIAFRTYQRDWVQLDAPRHLTIPSREGMRRIGCRAGLLLEAIVDDLTGFQFWASEQYKRGIPLRDERSHFMGNGQVFTQLELNRYSARAKKLNKAQLGDQAIFYFRKQGLQA